MQNAWIEEVERLQRENNELRKENKKLQEMIGEKNDKLVTLEDLQDTVDKINAWREEYERRQQSISQLGA
jgi:cell division septum initiation protein DivIVA